MCVCVYYSSVIMLDMFNFQAQGFKKQGTRIRKKMWLQNMKIKLVVLGILLFLVVIIWVSVCRGFDCTKQNS